MGVLLGVVVAALVLGACERTSGSGPRAPEPQVEPVRYAAPTRPLEPTPAPLPDAGTPPPAAEPQVAPATPPVEPAEPARTQKPIDMLTSRDAAFLVDYANSKSKESAQSTCEKEAKGDAEKQGVCLTKARDKFMPDVLKFRKDSETQVSLLVYKRNGSALRELWIGVVDLTEASPDSVKVKVTGRQKGTRPLWRGRSEVVITVPNEYSIEFDDPELGHLRYDAKIGLVTQ